MLRKKFRTATKGTKWWRLEIDRKTNLISLIAFLLSIASVASQAYFFFQGPRISLQPPDMVVFYKGEQGVDGRSYLKISSRMTFVNSGQPGFNDAISKEYAVVDLAGKMYLLFWKDFVSTDAVEKKLVVQKKEDAAPVVVTAGSAVTHETSFTPTYTPLKNDKPGANFLEFAEFEKMAIATAEIRVTLGYETFSGLKGGVRCSLVVDARFKDYLRNGWANPTCRRAAEWFDHFEPK